MNSDDPFALPDPDSGERTQFIPTPGGRRRPAASSRTAAEPSSDRDDLDRPTADPAAATEEAASLADRPATIDEPAVIPGLALNPVVAAASSLLMLAARLKRMVSLADVEALHARISRAIRQLHTDLLAGGVSEEKVRFASYAVCATIDDVVLNTPWGGKSTWAKRSMVGTFHRQVVGGERFFDNLSRLQSQPAQQKDILELKYLCLSLGFEGELRLRRQGATELAKLREDLYRLIRDLRGDFERALSPRWQGISTQHKPLAAYLPTWVVAVGAGTLLAAMFAAFFFATSDISKAALDRVAKLPREVKVGDPPPPTVLLPPPKPPEPAPELPRLRKFLQPEIEQKRVEVIESDANVVVRILGKGMFALGSVDVQPIYLPLLQRIGLALNEEAGRVLVAGHTDSLPISTLRFPSNWQLSTARAESVRAILAKTVREPGRLSAIGRADTEPIGDNSKEEGREANRRIEIVLLR